jgi:hypothetical protein
VSEPFDAAIHDERHKFKADTGKEYCRNILQPLVHKGQSVSVDAPVTQKGYSPVSMATKTVDLDIYRTDKDVASLSAGVRRTFLVQSDSPEARPGGPGVPFSAKVASISVKATDDLSTKLTDRKIDLSLYFGRTEIVANATATLTGESRYANMRYD